MIDNENAAKGQTWPEETKSNRPKYRVIRKFFTFANGLTLGQIFLPIGDVASTVEFRLRAEFYWESEKMVYIIYIILFTLKNGLLYFASGYVRICSIIRALSAREKSWNCFENLNNILNSILP